ncbi:E3 ubiquitin-protein ligase [Diplogelasinospora grovesii]|uniref:RING-type E3 ubiquitin transferase n=1 Tax=Diplogelasinospora grovesii TaxID=303347 RepID=A0AAN6N8V5_9PEZI|nr:E3 ubiquitin-protein ligase [Diplogelasinospora grovesii]
MAATSNGPKPNTDDIRSQVLQRTLTEISTSLNHPTDESPDSSSIKDANTKSPTDNNTPTDAVEADVCVICLDTVTSPCTASPCKHSNFDLLCLLSWLEQRPSCPLCKAPVQTVSYTSPTANTPTSSPSPSRNRSDEPRLSIYTVPKQPPPTTERPESSAENGRVSQQHRRFPLRRRLHHERLRGRPLPSEDEAITRRRYIYRHNLYSLHIGSNRHSQYRSPPGPEQFANQPHLVSRARLWIRRELQVFSYLSDTDTDTTSSSSGGGGGGGSRAEERLQTRRRNNAEFLLEYIVAILKTVDLQGSAGQAEDMLTDFLGREHARLFLHELRNWLRSPCQSLVQWDREVQYPHPQPQQEEEEGQRKRRRGPTDDDDDDDDDREGGTSREGEEDVDEWDRRRRGRSWRDENGGDFWRPG